jgi:glycosyltransferase involved in cell wall biosynthesis
MQPYPSDEPLVSFVITAYNTEKFISDCLESILRQKGNYDFEIVVVDDASTDCTEAVVRSYSDPRIRYIRHATNQGAFVTVNHGFKHAQGKFIARIDSDDRYRSDFLATTIPILQQYPEVGLVYSDIAMIDVQGRVTSEKGNVQRGDRPEKGNELIPLLTENFIPAPTILARREAWETALPVPEGYSFCDWFLSINIAKKWEFFYIDQVLADYRIHPQNMHRTMIRDKMGERITMEILDQVFHESDRYSELSKAKGSIYARNYHTLADKYFACEMNADARRCYLATIYHAPRTVLNLSVLRHLLATLIKRKHYESFKSAMISFSSGLRSCDVVTK